MQKSKEVSSVKGKNSIKKKKYVSKYHEKEINEISQLNKKVESINLHDDSETQIGPVVSTRKKSISKPKTAKKTPESKAKPESKEQLKKVENEKILAEYKAFLSTLCPAHSSKYESEALKQKPLSLQWYKQIMQIWKSQKDEKQQNKKFSLKHIKETIIKKTEKITDVQNITVELMKRLKPKHWLNDEVINSYIQLIDLEMFQKNDSKKDDWTVDLVKTYFAALKMTPERIDREINKRGLTDKSLLIVPINQDYHWFFLVIFQKKMFIFDSILSNSINQQKYLTLAKKVYSMKESIKRCIQLYQKMYQIQEFDLNQIMIITNYPQQDNQNDCGMMMLCGIKNVISRFLKIKRMQEMKEFEKFMEKKEFWNFCIQDVRCLRFVFAREIMEERLFTE